MHVFQFRGKYIHPSDFPVQSRCCHQAQLGSPWTMVTGGCRIHNRFRRVGRVPVGTIHNPIWPDPPWAFTRPNVLFPADTAHHEWDFRWKLAVIDTSGSLHLTACSPQMGPTDGSPLQLYVREKKIEMFYISFFTLTVFRLLMAWFYW